MKCWSLSHGQLFCNPVDCSPSGSCVHGILQARILEWVAISYFRGSSRPRDWTCVIWLYPLQFNLLIPHHIQNAGVTLVFFFQFPKPSKAYAQIALFSLPVFTWGKPSLPNFQVQCHLTEAFQSTHPTYGKASSVPPSQTVCFPAWLQALFYVGLIHRLPCLAQHRYSINNTHVEWWMTL